MHKSKALILSGLFCLSFLTGCATTATIEQSNAEVQLQSRETKIADLTSSLEKERQEQQRLSEALLERDKKIKELTLLLQKEKNKMKTAESGPSKSKGYYFFVIAMQAALRDAGFSLGLIDGKIGERTRAALKNFQKANSLPADGQIDKQTWQILRGYL